MNHGSTGDAERRRLWCGHGRCGRWRRRHDRGRGPTVTYKQVASVSVGVAASLSRRTVAKRKESEHVWSKEEGADPAVRKGRQLQFDKHVLKPVISQDVTPIVVHHTGHPQRFSSRKGATAGRGASSLGQKADVVLEFKLEEDRAFTNRVRQATYRRAATTGQDVPRDRHR
jgi:hypothetical protein